VKILVTGGTGFVGSELVKTLVARGDSVTVFSRSDGASGGARLQKWTPEAPGPWMESVGGFDAIVHLAGKSIADGRWTPEHLDACRRSRVRSTELLAEAVGASATKPRVWVNASAVGYYGMNRGTSRLSESAPPEDDVLSTMCLAWENATEPARNAGVRVALARIGIVLDQGGGALGKMLTPFRLGVGGPIGEGSQPFPWVHRADVVGAIVHALDTEAFSGPFNLVGPEASSMDAFAATLARILHRPNLFRVPAFALKLAVGDFAEAILTGQNAPPDALLASGYRFAFPTLQAALQDILSRGPST
jgi:hypothetical protein